MKPLSLVILFLCSVLAYTQDTLLHRDTAIAPCIAKGITLSWEKDANTKYAFDDGSNKPKELQKEYTTTKDAEGKDIIIPYKAVVNGKEDVLNAVIEITDTALNTAEVIFKTLNTGKSIPIIQQYKTPNGRKYTLQLKGTYDYAEEEVMAMLVPKDSGAKQQVIGSFKLVHLSPKTVKVVLVPLVENINASTVESKLNDIYEKVGITCKVSTGQTSGFSYDQKALEQLVESNSNLLSVYNDDMKALNNEYINYLGNNYDREAVYIFLLGKNNSGSKRDVLGFMPRGRQFGYVYAGALRENVYNTIAHEIGHGKFQMKHTFDKVYGGESNKSVANLMNYNYGVEIDQWQWKQMNDPAFFIGGFDKEGDGQWASKCNFYVHQRANEEGVKWLYSNVINKINIFSQNTKVDSFSINDMFQRSNNLLKQIEIKNIDMTNRIKFLNEGTVFADTKQFQSPENSYRHAMRNKQTNQTIEDAKNKADAFVRVEYQKAVNFKKQNLSDSAYFHFGIAMHVLQDATSPAHYGFQEWDDYKWYSTEPISHASIELSYPGFNSNLQKITNQYLEMFENNKQLPTSNLFDNIQHD